MSNPKLLLRIGLALPFLYAAISSILSPEDWIWYIPAWVQELFPADLLLLGHGVFELILAAWLLSGWRGFYAAVIAALDLLVITLFNISVFSVVFRDVGLFFMAAALAVMYREKEFRNNK